MTGPTAVAPFQSAEHFWPFERNRATAGEIGPPPGWYVLAITIVLSDRCRLRCAEIRRPSRVSLPANGAIAGYPSAGINRHVVGNERVLRERSGEPPEP